MMELSWSTPKRIIEHKEDASYGLERLEMVYGKPYVHQIKKVYCRGYMFCSIILWYGASIHGQSRGTHDRYLRYHLRFSLTLNNWWEFIPFQNWHVSLWDGHQDYMVCMTSVTDSCFLGSTFLGWLNACKLSFFLYLLMIQKCWQPIWNPWEISISIGARFHPSTVWLAVDSLLPHHFAKLVTGHLEDRPI